MLKTCQIWQHLVFSSALEIIPFYELVGEKNIIKRKQDLRDVVSSSHIKRVEKFVRGNTSYREMNHKRQTVYDA